MAMVAAGLASGAFAAGTLPTCATADTLTALRAYDDWDATLLDRTYRLQQAYVPPDLRSTYRAGLNGGHRVRAFVLPDLRAMAKAARAAGARLAVQSAYRSYSTQRSTFARWTSASGYAAALISSARAGHSEHQLGTTLDFRSYGGAAPWRYRDWGRTAAGRWLAKNAWKYGFLMSYPQNRRNVTCYSYEPWHFRYVGRSEAAEIRSSAITLREFLWQNQIPEPTPEPSGPPDPSPSNAPSQGVPSDPPQD